MSDILSRIFSQIDKSEQDLASFPNTSLDWVTRSKKTAEALVPWLESNSHDLKKYVEDILNASTKLRQIWKQIRDKNDIPKRQLNEFERLLELDLVLRETITGELISSVVMKFLTKNRPDLTGNGRSDYPDLFLNNIDYSELPVFKRSRDKKDVYGAALKGKDKRPVRVPDGLEIKTCRGKIQVDCHHDHVGLHLVVLCEEHHRQFTVTDLCIAFLNRSDYRQCERNTTATTVKYSFKGISFISLLNPK